MKATLTNQQLCIFIQKPMYLDEILDIYHVSKKLRHQLRMNKAILVDHQPVQHNPLIACENQLVIQLPHEEIDFIPQYIPFDVLYEDEVLLVINKPIHHIIYPEHKDEMNCIVNAIAFYYQQTNQCHAIRPIHRLDKDTSGILVFSKQAFFQAYFDEALATKKIKRHYLALIEGTISKPLTINANIGKDRHANKYRVSKSGQNAITHVKPIKSGAISLVECQLETGRTHQIRVHLASIQHPLLADPLYGHPSTLISRVALHSSHLELFHPLTNERLVVDCALNEDMKIFG